jgi:hypothetical protein
MNDLKMIESVIDSKISIALSQYETERLRRQSDLVFRVALAISWTLAVAMVVIAIATSARG